MNDLQLDFDPSLYPNPAGYPPWPTLSTRESEAPRLIPRPLPPSDQFTVKALYSYGRTDASELSFKIGDEIRTLGLTDSGWWYGELRGVRGLFPSNYCCGFDLLYFLACWLIESCVLG